MVKDVPPLDLVVGTQNFPRVAEYVEEALDRKSSLRWDDVRFSIVDVEEEAGAENTIHDPLLGSKTVSAFVSIMQGCIMHCSFCIVPSTRGEERSRPINEIVMEVEQLAASGVKEVTLLGQ